MTNSIRNAAFCVAVAASLFSACGAIACSTVMLNKGDELIYGHNLNQGDIGVPGMVFVNKRGVFKEGRTLSELITRDQADPSTARWISRYGSVTFNSFGRDLPDGGINEAGLYIWEMNEAADYPQDDALPKLMHANWMQYVLDNCATIDEAVRTTKEVTLDGWTWHYFISDKSGDSAALAFIDGEVVIHRGESMPVPGLFNSPYARELELLPYFSGFGGQYDPNLGDPEVPRFVKAAVMIRDYEPAADAVTYGFTILDKIMVSDVPEWSILIDARRMDIYFKTRINPAVKRFSMNELDFSNQTPVLVLDIDFPGSEGENREPPGVGNGLDVSGMLHPFTYKDIYGLLTSITEIPELPDSFFTSGGLTVDQWAERFAGHYQRAEQPERQSFAGGWKWEEDSEDGDGFRELILRAEGTAVSGVFANSRVDGSAVSIEHIHMVGHKLIFTFRPAGTSRIMEATALIDGDEMYMEINGIEDWYGDYRLRRER